MCVCVLIDCVGVRSSHLFGVWRFSERNEPHLLQVVNTKDVATCISIRLASLRSKVPEFWISN